MRKSEFQVFRGLRMKNILIVVLLSWAAGALGDPAPLVIDKSKRGRASDSKIESVHQEITTGTTDLRKIRLAIVNGMLETKGRVWTYEGEGVGYILARFDYRGHTIVVRIEYNQALVQLKFHGGSEAYECENLQEDGVCYKNHKGYFNYTPNLRASIVRNLQLVSTGASS
jgi:hypothetical protein